MPNQSVSIPHQWALFLSIYRLLKVKLVYKCMLLLRFELYQLAFPVVAICTLEYSAKWPNDLSAILHIKTAFYARIAEELSTVKGILASPTSDFVDILKNGFVFRVRIAYEREVLLMKNELKFKSGENLKRYKSAVRTAEMETMIKPKLTSALSGYVCRNWMTAYFNYYMQSSGLCVFVVNLTLSYVPILGHIYPSNW